MILTAKSDSALLPPERVVQLRLDEEESKAPHGGVVELCYAKRVESWILFLHLAGVTLIQTESDALADPGRTLRTWDDPQRQPRFLVECRGVGFHIISVGSLYEQVMDYMG